MNRLNSIFILAAAFLAVYLETSVEFFRQWVGAQVDPLPAIMVYAALRDRFATVVMVALGGGLWLDSLSENDLGVSVLGLLVVGAVLFQFRSLLLRGEWFAQFLLGAGASLVCPLITLLLLTGMGSNPLLTWGSAWQLMVMAAGGGLCAPICFALFGLLNHAFNYQHKPETAFRPNREMKRGRA